MSLEIEKRYRNYNESEIKDKLEKLGFVNEGRFMFKFCVFKKVDGRSIRIRDEGHKVTFTIKEKTPTYEKEWEQNIDDYDKMKEMLLMMSMEKDYEMEKFREIFHLENTEIVLDTYPGLESYMEIESNTEEELFKYQNLLGLSDEPNFSSRDLYFEKYNIPKVRDNTDLLFSNFKDIFVEYL